MAIAVCAFPSGSRRPQRLRKRGVGRLTKRRILQWGLLLAALALMSAGVAQGDARDVLMKASRICMECIGIG